MSVDSIVRLSPSGKGQPRPELRPRTEGEVSVSQERAAAFRAWLAQ